MRTKGKLHAGPIDNGAIYDSANKLVFSAHPSGKGMQEDAANCQHLVQCWNSHDDLLAACRELIEANKYARAVSLKHEAPRGSIWCEARLLLDTSRLAGEAAIAEATPSE